MIRLGYCCQNLTLGDKGKFKTITQKKALSLSDDERRREIQRRTINNFENLKTIMQWNIDNSIKQYRVSSDLVVFATHEANTYNWLNDSYVIQLCDEVKQMAIDNNIRLSIHPSQYNVVSTDKPNVLENTIKQLSHEAEMCRLLGIQDMCVHIGSKYPERFIANFPKLPDNVKQLIRLENDRHNNTEITLNVCYELNIPMILDFHHHKFNPTNDKLSEYMEYIIDTWNGRVPVMHISSSRDEEKLSYSHHDYIAQCDFDEAINYIGNNDVALEFECKCKDLALLKYSNFIR